ncbi:hypothetical protein G9A89_004840 [Geosiphon pyriformis]|nr:hypothetical protein G9A89_004840 [Geosiphon pyriformis]
MFFELAYAIFAALKFLEIYKPSKKPIVVTFGQPRMGNEVFTAFAQTKLEARNFPFDFCSQFVSEDFANNIFRVTLMDDWLPDIPIQGRRYFSKWDDTNKRPTSLVLPVKERYTHFKPEFWIEINCECSQDIYPTVYKCLNTHSFDEHPECNARKHEINISHGFLHENKSDEFHFGPYFGQNMNDCQNLNRTMIKGIILQKKVPTF